MSLSITSSMTALSAARTNLAGVPQGVRDGVKALGQALRAEDLPAAREAYVSLVKQAPEGASFQPGSAFADLGKALVKGDVDGAKTAFTGMVKAQLGRPSTIPVQPPQVPAAQQPVVSSTGGSAGGTLNAVA